MLCCAGRLHACATLQGTRNVALDIAILAILVDGMAMLTLFRHAQPSATKMPTASLFPSVRGAHAVAMVLVKIAWMYGDSDIHMY